MKKLAVWGLAAALSLTWAQAAYAGQWVQDVNRAENSNGISNWWYRQDDGSYPAGGWFWIDGNGDGFAKATGLTEAAGCTLRRQLTGMRSTVPARGWKMEPSPEEQ